MEIKDLFSHKIHSSGDDWPNKLIDIASIFSEFDGKPYDRSAIETRLSEISPRSSAVARDPSKFRDEISAYPAYLGLYRVELIDNQWHIFLSHTAKQFLTSEEPNVAAFMLLQMTLFQYPNGMGVAYSSGSSSVRIQSNTRDRTLDFIENGIHLSPLRLICMGLRADSILKEITPLEAALTLDEVFVLANQATTNSQANPNIEDVINALISHRNGELVPPEKYESRFHILKHTNFLVSGRNGIRIRDALSETDAKELLLKLDTINSIDTQFKEFDNASNSEELLDEVRSCSWGRYFDGVKTLESDKVNILTSENPAIYSELEIMASDGTQNKNIEIIKSENIYTLRQVDFSKTSSDNKTKRKTIYTDPELTKIRRQRANLSHKVLLEKLHDYLESQGATPYENEHIDLFAELPSKDKYVFEVKSITVNNLLSQTRKGVSQLYEYRYRYQDIIGYDVNLFLVYPQEPVVIPWLQEYLCTDRHIGIIWFDENDQIQFSENCTDMAKPLMNENAI
ncbi:MAG: hypothetical protein KAT04_07950 [Methylococcales bacterium]|nr:hypothetical protein [Methylococcales bacterium]